MASTTNFQKGQSGMGTEHRGPDVMDKAKDAGVSAMDQARDIAGTAANKAKDAAATIGNRAEDATHAVGRGMESLADTVRQNLPREGVIGSAASTVAGGLESGGRYLEKEGLQGMADDVTDLIRRNPIPALFVGIGLGFLLARLTTSSRS